MPLTLKQTGVGGGPDVFPVKIDYSALMESGYSSTGAPATNATMALGWKPTAATSAPLGDMTGHYALTIRKVGSDVTVWKGAAELDAYGGSAGSTYAELVDNVLTYYGGAEKGYYSRLTVVEDSLDYSSFWEPSEFVTGLFIPRDISGLSVHTLLDFSNAADLGEDSSGNGNHWTVTGTQTEDTPTNNACVLNALDPNAGTLSGGNLTLASGTAKPTLQPESGKWSYKKGGVEQLYDADVSGKFEPDLTADAYAFTGYTPTAGYRLLTARYLPTPTILKSDDCADIVLREGIGDGEQITGSTATADSDYSTQTAAKAVDGTTTYFWQSGGAAFPHWLQVDLGSAAQLETYDITARADAQLARTPYTWVFQGSNNASDWTDLDTRTAEAFTSLGQKRSFAIASPGSYRYYRVYITANQGSGDNYTAIAELNGQLAPAAVDSLLFPPDFVNIKDRDAAYSWWLVDSKRGNSKTIYTDSANAQDTLSNAIDLTSNGYDLGTYNNINKAGDSFVDLCLKAGADQGFEIVKYTGNSVAGRTISHNLGKTPTFMIVKNLTSAVAWTVYHSALGATRYLQFDTSAAATASDRWNDTAPTSTTFTVGDSTRVNYNGHEYVAYLFTDSDVFKAFSYTGNGSTDGPFVNLGGRPLAVPFWKDSTTSGINWLEHSAMQSPHNPSNEYLYPNLAAVEGSSGNDVLFTSQGMKVANNDGNWNTSGATYVGLAILESAAKYANAF